jgi:hypothetical protein
VRCSWIFQSSAASCRRCEILCFSRACLWTVERLRGLGTSISRRTRCISSLLSREAMTVDNLVDALALEYPRQLCVDLVAEYQNLRMDSALGTLSRSSPGKIVETLAQILDFKSTGVYSVAPHVEAILTRIESDTSLDDGLRLCASRMGRVMYTLRNKRGIIHKSGIPPNTSDLELLLHCTRWVITELLRHAAAIPMEAAKSLVRMVQAPVGQLIEDLGERRLVLVDCTAKEEVLVLLQTFYPEYVSLRKVLICLARMPEKTVRNVLQTLWRHKSVDRVEEMQYRLTLKGLDEAATIARQLQAA